MTDPKTLHRGDVLVHRCGDVAVLDRRKEDDSGWWLVGHGGLADSVIVKSRDWVLPTPVMLARLFVIWQDEFAATVLTP